MEAALFLAFLAILAAPGVVFLILRKRTSLAPRRRAVILAASSLPFLIVAADLATRGVQQSLLNSRWGKLRKGTHVREVEALLGKPDRIWAPGQATHNLLFGWRNARPIWEYYHPMDKAFLWLGTESPFVRIRSPLDNLRLFGPTGYYLQVDREGRVHSIGSFREMDVM